MTPHEEHYPHRPSSDDGNHWGAIPLLLSMLAIAIVGILVLTGSF
jgi:hypothetical protein